MPRGIQMLAGTQFDVRGLIQVGSSTRGGQPYPRGIEEVNVRLRCERMHFLHSAIMAFDIKPGTELGHYVIFYEDGSIHGIPIIFGRDVADWFTQPNENLPALKAAWTGENEASRAVGRKVRLFKSTWENPRPDVPIKHLNFHASHPRAAPFLVAVTVDPPQ